LFSELGGIIQKLEDKVYTEKTHQASIIHLDKNENLKGLEHLDILYQAILKKICLKIKYKSFKAREGTEIIIHPYILKEFNNRWFLIGKKNREKQLLTLALDRIEGIDFDLKTKYIQGKFNGDNYYKNTIGVTVLNDEQCKEVVLEIDRSNAPYVITKPFHHSQETLEKLPNGGVRIQIKVHLNFELERMILGFGNSIEVISPRILRNKIKRKLSRALGLYE